MTQKIDIIIGTMLGTAEFLADEIAVILEQKGLDYQLHAEPNLDDLDPNHLWLICCSTHGAGDLPDNIIKFHDQLSTSDHKLDQLSFAVIALGDSSYDTFCGAGKTLRQALLNKDATEQLPMLEIDAMHEDLPEDQAQAWIHTWVNTIL